MDDCRGLVLEASAPSSSPILQMNHFSIIYHLCEEYFQSGEAETHRSAYNGFSLALCSVSSSVYCFLIHQCHQVIEFSGLHSSAERVNP